MTTTCLSCGDEIDDGERVCPACGARRRSKLGSPALWMGRSARHRSTVVGIAIAVVVAAFLAWHIATQGHGPDVQRHLPVNVDGR